MKDEDLGIFETDIDLIFQVFLGWTENKEMLNFEEATLYLLISEVQNFLETPTNRKFKLIMCFMDFDRKQKMFNFHG